MRLPDFLRRRPAVDPPPEPAPAPAPRVSPIMGRHFITQMTKVLGLPPIRWMRITADIGDIVTIETKGFIRKPMAEIGDALAGRYELKPATAKLTTDPDHLAGLLHAMADDDAASQWAVHQSLVALLAEVQQANSKVDGEHRGEMWLGLESRLMSALMRFDSDGKMVD